jgi:hypothetical protein
MSILIVISNNILTLIIKNLTLLEKHDTLTSLKLSTSFKLTLAKFSNTCIIPLICNHHLENWFDNGGLVINVFFIMITISIIDPLLSIYDIPGLWRRIQRWREKKKGNKSFMKQIEANK